MNAYPLFRSSKENKINKIVEGLKAVEVWEHNHSKVMIFQDLDHLKVKMMI